ncbi:MAG: peptidase M11, partial [Lysobacter sp.]|nr:peptidase M11 [Lysobacter sp.]
MFSLALRRSLSCTVAALLLFAAGVASAQTPTFAPSLIGKPVTLEGRLEVLVEDYADGHAAVRHFLVTKNDRIPLQFAGRAPQLASGTRVRVHGRAQSDALEIGAGAGDIVPLETVLPDTMGEQSIAVLLVNFQDDTSQPKTIAQAQDLVFGEVSNHYRESSFGQTSFKGQAFGWYTVAMSKNACDPYKLASLADAQATAAGVNLAAYQRRVYMFPAMACPWLGLGTIGGVGTQAWINGTLNLWVVGHEMGHNYGLHHAHSLDCDTTVTDWVCNKFVYGDAADIMGNNLAGQFSPFQKERLGWLNDGISPPITTVAANGRYSIEPYSASTAGIKALKIPRGTDSSGHKLWYYVEYRQPIGVDAVLANAGNLTQGVMVRIATEGDAESMYQLDMTPGSSNEYFKEMADGALGVGKTFYDGDTGVSLTLASANGVGADIDVNFGPTTCTRATPSVWLGAVTPSGVPAGSSVSYQIQVTNYDSPACPATTFDLAQSVPAGWTAKLDLPSVTIKPGITGIAVLDVTSSGSAALGTYKIGMAASSAIGAVHTANAYSVDYVVIPPCHRVAPTVTLTGGGTGVRAGTRVTYT